MEPYPSSAGEARGLWSQMTNLDDYYGRVVLFQDLAVSVTDTGEAHQNDPTERSDEEAEPMPLVAAQVVFDPTLPYTFLNDDKEGDYPAVFVCPTESESDDGRSWRHPSSTTSSSESPFKYRRTNTSRRMPTDTAEGRTHLAYRQTSSSLLHRQTTSSGAGDPAPGVRSAQPMVNMAASATDLRATGLSGAPSIGISVRTTSVNSADVAKVARTASDPVSSSFLHDFWHDTSQLPTHEIIAHNQEAQKFFDDWRKPVPWGVQFKLARGVSAGEWTWKAVREKIAHFQGTTDDRMGDIKVKSIMKGWDLKGPLDNAIGEELHREQLAICENKGRGLGLRPWHGDNDWHGGQVQQIATVVKNDDSFKIWLEPLHKRRSTLLARFLGSRRVLQLHVPMRGEKIEEFLSQKFVLNGKVFMVLPPKDSGFYVVEVNEDSGRESRKDSGDWYRMSFGDILNWHIPMDLNADQVLQKLFARLALAMSNTVPVLEFAKESIIFIRDEVVPGFDSPKSKPPANKILTDGCGFINAAAMKRIKTK
ncbi:hypothetical protein D9758_002239 [Tetrapyrgos nigripes]|uniref:RNA-dependent RNA polymerase n=1 Tax=Tetrapyrgos nigripes TaxID=182062 RepID=A0A8H5GP36_9AGAR|nr:hypothetical protein D9758_002239 [Tetrapyrgos nigripes]